MKNKIRLITQRILLPNVDYEDSVLLDIDDIETLGYSLRECIEELFKTRTSAVGGISHMFGVYDEFNTYITVFNSMEFETGCYEERTLHFKTGGITKSSFIRLCKLLNITDIQG